MQITPRQFANMVRSLFNIDGYQLPELTREQQLEFVRDPARYFINTDKAQNEAIFREVAERQPAELTGEVAPDVLAALCGLADNAGSLRAFEYEIRDAAGNTNWQCLMDAVAKADAAIDKAIGAA